MKKIVVFAVLAAIVASCADDNPPQIEKSSELVSPRLLMDVSTESGQSPLTGILTIICRLDARSWPQYRTDPAHHPWHLRPALRLGVLRLPRLAWFPRTDALLSHILDSHGCDGLRQLRLRQSQGLPQTLPLII